MFRKVVERRWLLIVVLLVLGIAACRERPLQEGLPANVPLDGSQSQPGLAVPTQPGGELEATSVPVEATPVPTDSADAGYPAPGEVQPTEAAPGGDQGGQLPGVTPGGTVEPTTEPAPTTPPQDVTYVVQAGDTIGVIAQTYGVSIDAIVQANGLINPNAIQAGQSLIIPLSGNLPTPAPATERTHIVAYGETLFSIALFYGVDLNTLAAYNGITDPTRILAGQELRIPPAQP